MIYPIRLYCLVLRSWSGQVENHAPMDPDCSRKTNETGLALLTSAWREHPTDGLRRLTAGAVWKQLVTSCLEKCGGDGSECSRRHEPRYHIGECGFWRLGMLKIETTDVIILAVNNYAYYDRLVGIRSGWEICKAHGLDTCWTGLP